MQTWAPPVLSWYQEGAAGGSRCLCQLGYWVGWWRGGCVGAWGLSWGAAPTEGDASVSGKREMQRWGEEGLWAPSTY